MLQMLYYARSFAFGKDMLIPLMGYSQVLGTEELNAYLNKYHIDLDPELRSLVGW